MFSRLKNWLIRNCVKAAVLTASRPVAAGLSRFVNDDEAYRLFSHYGFHLLRKHYCVPIPEEADLSTGFWEKSSEMVGIEVNDELALHLLRDIFPRYVVEFRELFPIVKRLGAKSFYLLNGTFMAVDSHAYYAIIRHFKPKEIIEIGSGYSTMVAAVASLKNKQNGLATRLTSIEPFPSQFLREGFAGLSMLIEQRVQDVDLSLFTSLTAGDILFIDSTHVLRAGGDVQQEYCEILPRLAPGVLVHIHDISLPRPYPRVYFEKNHYFWNEQYLLQAFLTFNSKFEVIWPGNYLMTKFPERVREAFPEYDLMRAAFPQSEPSSFWMRVRG